MCTKLANLTEWGSKAKNSFDTSCDACKEYIGFNCIIHTKRQCQRQDWHQNSNGFWTDPKASSLASTLSRGVNHGLNNMKNKHLADTKSGLCVVQSTHKI